MSRGLAGICLLALGACRFQPEGFAAGGIDGSIPMNIDASTGASDAPVDTAPPIDMAPPIDTAPIDMAPSFDAVPAIVCITGGSGPCVPPNVCCYDRNGGNPTVACQSVAQRCGGLAFACDGPEDCNGELCCNGAGGSACKATCDNGERRMCHGDDDCKGTGLSCAALGGTLPYSVCGP